MFSRLHCSQSMIVFYFTHPQIIPTKHLTFPPRVAAVAQAHSMVSDYGLDDWGSIPGRAEDFSSSLCVQTVSGAHPASYPMGTGGPFPGGKARPGPDADHSPPFSAEVKYE
jgi:hypothetical protein